MLKRQFSFIVIIFLLTTTLIVVLQYNANKNIDELVSGNENLLAGFTLRSGLQTLQNELLTLDNNVRTSIIGKGNTRVDISENVSRIRAGVKQLGELLVTDSSQQLWNHLDSLAEEKISLSYQVLDTLSVAGKESAENVIKKQHTAELSQAIENVSAKLDLARQNDLVKILRQTDANSIGAKSLQGVLAIVAVMILMFTLWFVVSRIRKQLSMISMLNESEKKVREAARVKEQFIANMSHEIRTPLNAIIGFTKLLQKHPRGSSSDSYINAISTSGENLLNIINDILDLSKIEAGMMRVENSQIETRALFESVYNMFVTRAMEKGLAFQLQVDEDVPVYIKSDPVRITQIAVNLVSNAIKFTHKGFVKIQVMKLPYDNKNFLLGMKVTDSGIGIPIEMKEQVFDRFTQAESDTTRKYGGTGLGLSIVKQIVQLMKGTIAIESPAPGGTEFMVCLPAAVSPEPYIKNLPAINHLMNGIGRNNTILVVEDNPMNQMLMGHLLDNWKINYRFASTADEALVFLKNEKIDLILMDIQLPEMDGYMAAKKVREELHLDVPIIAMTAHAFAGEKEKCLGYGMNDYLPKPIMEEQLIELLNKHLPLSLNTGPENPDNFHSYLQFINLDYLNQLANGNKEFKKNILQQFLIQAPEETSLLEKAFISKDLPAIKSRAHNLKTTISFLGLQQHLPGHLELLENIEASQLLSSEHHSALNKVLSVCSDATKEAAALLPSFN